MFIFVPFDKLVEKIGFLFFNNTLEFENNYDDGNVTRVSYARLGIPAKRHTKMTYCCFLYLLMRTNI